MSVWTRLYYYVKNFKQRSNISSILNYKIVSNHNKRFNNSITSQSKNCHYFLTSFYFFTNSHFTSIKLNVSIFYILFNLFLHHTFVFLLKFQLNTVQSKHTSFFFFKASHDQKRHKFFKSNKNKNSKNFK